MSTISPPPAALGLVGAALHPKGDCLPVMYANKAKYANKAQGKNGPCRNSVTPLWMGRQSWFGKHYTPVSRVLMDRAGGSVTKQITMVILP